MQTNSLVKSQKITVQQWVHDCECEQQSTSTVLRSTTRTKSCISKSDGDILLRDIWRHVLTFDAWWISTASKQCQTHTSFTVYTVLTVVHNLHNAMHDTTAQDETGCSICSSWMSMQYRRVRVYTWFWLLQAASRPTTTDWESALTWWILNDNEMKITYLLTYSAMCISGTTVVSRYSIPEMVSLSSL